MSRNIIDALAKRKLIAAHRGARSLAPENTLAAARLASDAGADMWEIDVRMTRDEEVVLIHDPDLRRTSNASGKFPGRQPWRVHDFSLDELKTLDFGSWFGTADPFGRIRAGEISPAEVKGYFNQPVVTLGEAIQFSIENDFPLNIEIKDLSGLRGDALIAEKVVSLVHTYGAVENVLVSSFNHNYLRQIKQLDKRMMTGALVHAVHPDPVGLMVDLGALTFNPSLRAFRPWQIRGLKKRRVDVLVWVVNNPRLARILFALGADGVFTDFPQRFSAHKVQ